MGIDHVAVIIKKEKMLLIEPTRSLLLARYWKGEGQQ